MTVLKSLSYCLAFTLTFLRLDIVDSAMIWPFPTLIGDKFDFTLGITVYYSIVLPDFSDLKLLRRRRNSLAAELKDNVNDYFDFSTREGVAFARLVSLFNWMGLEEAECQKRLLCMVTQSQNKYSPLSDLIFQHFDPRVDYQMMATNGTSSSKFHEFYNAGRKGIFPGTDCNEETALCHTNPDKVIDWNALRTFQLLKQSYHMKFLN